MKTIVLICECCGAPLTNHGQGYATCRYCQTINVFEDFIPSMMHRGGFSSIDDFHMNGRKLVVSCSTCEDALAEWR